MEITNLIKQEIYDYENKDIFIVPALGFKQKTTIEQIYRYLGSKYETGEIDADGDKKYFFNIVRSPSRTTTKAIDFDTKDVRILTASGGNPKQTWFFERDFRHWAKDKGFGRILNRIFDELPKFGSVVLKVVNGKPYFVDLRNFMLDKAADILDDSNFLTERHPYTAQGYRKIAKQFNLEKTDEVLKRYYASKEKFISLYERYGEVKNEKGDYVYMRTYFVDIKTEDGKETNQPQSSVLIVKQEEIDKHPYWEFHLEKIAGRWLGIGVVELLFDNQMRANEVANQESKGTYWASLRVFQTRDQNVNRNLKRDVKTGEVLKSESEITPVDMTERNLSYFIAQTNKWLQNRDELTFAYDVVQGERLPSGTPLGSARLAAGMASSYFAQIRENIALDIKNFLYEAIFPSFEEEMTAEHALLLVGEDLNEYNDMILESEASRQIFGSIAKGGKIPNAFEYQEFKSVLLDALNAKKEHELKLPKSFYKNIKYKIDIVITGEGRDITTMAQSLWAILQAITADPTMLFDPIKKSILSQLFEVGGVDKTKIDLTTPRQPLMMPQGAGGGVSAPKVMPQVAGMTTEVI